MPSDSRWSKVLVPFVSETLPGFWPSDLPDALMQKRGLGLRIERAWSYCSPLTVYRPSYKPPPAALLEVQVPAPSTPKEGDIHVEPCALNMQQTKSVNLNLNPKTF